jgi:deazaflavin-dependent oxidoreductase (nitroreductase family)
MIMASAPKNRIDLGPKTRWVIRFVALFVNPLTLLVAGRSWMPIVGVLHHVGRRSGRAYATPLGMHLLGDTILLPRTFGDNAAWYQNVLAAGSCAVTYRGKSYSLIDPEIVDYAIAARAFPGFELFLFRVIGINEYLRLHLAPAGWTPKLGNLQRRTPQPIRQQDHQTEQHRARPDALP